MDELYADVNALQSSGLIVQVGALAFRETALVVVNVLQNVCEGKVSVVLNSVLAFMRG